ncbi:MAG TPA: PIN domain-containing protein [Symbiobacteriaceae bacterium]
MVVKIVADTNLIQGHGSFHFENNLWPVILAAIRSGLAELLVPEVVVQELVTHYSEEVKRSLRELRKLHGTLGRLRVNVDVCQSQKPEDEVISDYEMWLRACIDMHGRILPLPTVPHDRLLKDTLSGRKPLSRGDGGYRDALIWHSLLDVARVCSDDIILLSENTKDFADSTTGQLSPDLRADLSGLGSEAVVRLVTSLQGLVDSLVPEDPMATDKVSKFLSSEAGINALNAALNDHFEADGREEFTGRPRALPNWLLSPDIEGFQKVDTPQEEAAYKLGTNTWLVKAVVRGLAYVGGYTHPVSLNGLDADDFEVWDRLGTEQVYAVHSLPQPVRAVLCFSWSTSNGIFDMAFLTLDLMTDHLIPPPDYPVPEPPPPDPAGTYKWLQVQLKRLLLLDPPQFSSAIGSELYISGIRSALETINSSSAVRTLPPAETMPIAPDNLGSMLIDRLGIQSLLNTLDRLRFNPQ